jgi:hypothetical protein
MSQWSHFRMYAPGESNVFYVTLIDTESACHNRHTHIPGTHRVSRIFPADVVQFVCSFGGEW